MDRACKICLLGESVLVRVPARTLALLGFFIVQCILTPFFLIKYLSSSSTLEGGVLSCLAALWERGNMSERTLEGGASRVRGTSSDDSRVDRIARA